MNIKNYRIIGLLVCLSGAPAVAEPMLGLLPDDAICSNALRNGQWETAKEKIKYVEEARTRNLSCGSKTKGSKVKYSNGYVQAYLKCGSTSDGRRGWNTALDGYANPQGFVLYRTYISRGEIGYTFLQARRSKTFGNKNGWHVTGQGRRESGNPWSLL